MRQERTAEGADVEVVGQRVLLGDVPHRHLAAVVVTHDQAACIGMRREHVVLAAVDLHLIVIEAVHQIARDHGRIHIEAVLAIDLERAVRVIGRLRLGNHFLLARDGHAAPGRR